jgi:NAD(P)-dependent dehydrogenase (short-subunit alcohol dehydrogenase family)
LPYRRNWVSLFQKGDKRDIYAQRRERAVFDLDLKGKVALVTGGSDGLGRAAAHRLALEGASVVICGRRADHAQQAAQDLTAAVQASGSTGGVVGLRADVTKSDDCEALIAEIRHLHGGIDILINNAGASAAMGLALVEDDLWLSDFNLKVMAAVRLSRLAIPMMTERGGGAIVNANISGGKAPNAGALPTSVMRAAGLNLTKSLAQEFAASNIRVNAICIGYLKSMQWIRRAENGDPSSIYENFAQKIPLGRIGEAEEYADLVAFLSSKRASYITGTAVNLDGGLCPVV